MASRVHSPPFAYCYNVLFPTHRCPPMPQHARRPLPGWISRSTRVGRAWLGGADRIGGAVRRVRRCLRLTRPTGGATSKALTSTAGAPITACSAGTPSGSSSPSSIASSPVVLERPSAGDGSDALPTLCLEQLNLGASLDRREGAAGMARVWVRPSWSPLARLRTRAPKHSHSGPALGSGGSGQGSGAGPRLQVV